MTVAEMNSETMVKKYFQSTLFVAAGSDCEKANNLHCIVLNIDNFDESDELTSKTFYVQSLPFRVIIKREQKGGTKKSRPVSTLSIQLVVGEKIEEWPSKFSIQIRSKDGSRSMFDETFEKELSAQRNSVNVSIDWEKLGELKDLPFEVVISADFPDGGYESRAGTGYNGIHNEGATCYINSLLQSLYCTNAFRRIVYGIPIEPEDVNDSFVFWLKYIFYSLQFGESTDVRTVKMIECFNWDEMNTTTQQDIQEFLRRLMDKLEQFLDGSVFKDRLISLFVGELEKTTLCKNVSHQSSRIETFWDLQLSIETDSTLFGAFQTYLTSSEISDYDYGDGKDDAEIKLQFTKFPPVLHIQLGRFKYDPKSNAVVKNNKRLEFYSELDLTQYCPDADYILHSVLVHSGKASSGHYIAYICPKADGQWYKFNDTIVTKCSTNQAIESNYGGDRLTSNAYMLIYIKKSYVSEILREVGQHEVVSEDLIKIEMDKEAKELAEQDDSYEIVIFTPEILEKVTEYKPGKVLFDQKYGLTFQISKDKLLCDFIGAIGDAYSLTNLESIKMWQLNLSKDTIKESANCSDIMDKPLSKCFNKDRVHFFVELPLAGESLSTFDKSQQALVLIIEHNPSSKEGRLRFFASHYFNLSDTVQAVQAYIRNEIGHEGDDEDIAIMSESCDSEVHDGDVLIKKIASRCSGTLSVRIVFELLNGNEKPKYLSSTTTKAKTMDRSNKQSTQLSSPTIADGINVTGKRDTNCGEDLIKQQSYENTTELCKIVQHIAELTNNSTDCIQLFDAENNVIEKEFLMSTLQDFNSQRNGPRSRGRMLRSQKPKEIIFSYKTLEQHYQEPASTDLFDDMCAGEPMECDDYQEHSSSVPIIPPSSPMCITESTDILVTFVNIYNKKEYFEFGFPPSSDTSEVLQSLTTHIKTKVTFFDNSEIPLDESSKTGKLERLLCAGEDSLTIFYEYLDENEEDVPSSTPIKPEKPAKPTRRVSPLFSIDVTFKNRHDPKDKAEYNFKTNDQVYNVLKRFASDRKMTVDDLVFYLKSDDLLEATEKPLERYKGLDDTFLDIFFEMADKPSKKYKPTKKSPVELDNSCVLTFKDRLNENSVLDLEFDGKAKLSEAIAQISEVMELKEKTTHFFDSKVKEISRNFLNTSIDTFLKNNKPVILYDIIDKSEIRLQHVDQNGMPKDVVRFVINKQTRVEDICKVSKLPHVRVLRMKDGIIHSVVSSNTRAASLVGDGFEHRLDEYKLDVGYKIKDDTPTFFVCVRFVGDYWPEERLQTPILVPVSEGHYLLRFGVLIVNILGSNVKLMEAMREFTYEAEDPHILQPDPMNSDSLIFVKPRGENKIPLINVKLNKKKEKKDGGFFSTIKSYM